MTVQVYLSFSEIWIADYDHANYTIDLIVAELNATTTIIVDTSAWFEEFFGPEGVVTSLAHPQKNKKRKWTKEVAADKYLLAWKPLLSGSRKKSKRSSD